MLMQLFKSAMQSTFLPLGPSINIVFIYVLKFKHGICNLYWSKTQILIPSS